jgi:hypothetical protein
LAKWFQRIFLEIDQSETRIIWWEAPMEGSSFIFLFLGKKRIEVIYAQYYTTCML